jgi:hypothetical protein
MEPTSNIAAYFHSALQGRADADLERFRAAAKQVAELEGHPGWVFLRELLQEKADRLHAEVLPPEVHQHATYIALTNQEYGIRKVLEVPEAMRIVAERADEKQRKAAEAAARKEKRNA